MKEKNLTIPEIAQIAGTRVVLGVGLGLLIADKLSVDQRKAVGWALFAVGALITIPIVANVLAKGPSQELSADLAEVPR